MAKVKALFVCSACLRPSAQWSGRCSGCGDWGTVSEHPAGTANGTLRRKAGLAPVLTLVHDPEERRIRTGFPHVDRVLGGGLAPGSVVLLAGAPGIGKSTLLLQLGSRLADAGHPCLLASGEESRNQVAARARRLGLDGGAMGFVPGRDLADVISAAQSQRPEVLIVDSIQTIRDADSDALPGGVGQVRACADALIALAKEQGITVLLAGHVTKGGDLAGPRTLEHAVDAVLAFEGDPRSGMRILCGGKNRFGPEGEVGWFEMTTSGLAETEPGSRIGDGEVEAGCATALVMAGRRAFAVDVQALVIPCEGPPKRQVVGLDARRFSIMAAVVDRALDLRLVRSELYGTTAGGMKLDDPGADLAMAAALASASVGRPPPSGCAFVGEVSLTGTVRPTPGLEQRLAAARAAGVDTVLVAASTPQAGDSGPGPSLVRVRHVRDALAWALLRGRPRPFAPGGRTNDVGAHG